MIKKAFFIKMPAEYLVLNVNKFIVSIILHFVLSLQETTLIWAFNKNMSFLEGWELQSILLKETCSSLLQLFRSFPLRSSNTH